MEKDNEVVTISTFKDALLQWAEDGDLEAGDLVFSGELAKFTAHIDGKNYNSSIPGELEACGNFRSSCTAPPPLPFMVLTTFAN